jgi:hypothetical protein
MIVLGAATRYRAAIFARQQRTPIWRSTQYNLRLRLRWLHILAGTAERVSFMAVHTYRQLHGCASVLTLTERRQSARRQRTLTKLCH